MHDLLEIIKASLKDTHIGNGSRQEFDQVCLQLYTDISKSKPWSALYVKGKRDGRGELQAEIRELLGVKEPS